jgi:hypothetical protein
VAARVTADIVAIRLLLLLLLLMHLRQACRAWKTGVVAW